MLCPVTNVSALITKRCSLGLSLKLFIFPWKLVNILWESTLRLCEYLVSYQTSNLFIYLFMPVCEINFPFCSLSYNLLLSWLIWCSTYPKIGRSESVSWLLCSFYCSHFFLLAQWNVPCLLHLSLLQLWNPPISVNSPASFEENGSERQIWVLGVLGI